MKKTIFFISCIFIGFYSYAQTQLWGMTASGGYFGTGEIFNTDASGNNQSVVELNPVQIEGANPFYTNLLQASDGKFYGVTGNGGAYNKGILFQYDPATLIFTRKYDFEDTRGSYPYGSLVQASDGKIYGTTNSGGSHARGVVFQFDPVTAAYADKFDFDGTAHGQYPGGALIQATDGKLYGMTFQGGINSNYGVIFQYDPVTAVCTKKFDFAGTSTGRNPYGSLMQASDGMFYGMTHFGGSNGSGVLFRFNPVTLVLTDMLNFSGAANGSIPIGSLIQAANGKLYGMTQEGGVNNQGVLFEFDPATSVYVKELDFDGPINGSRPCGDVMQASNGMLYGMTTEGGANNSGILFQYDITTSTFTKKMDFSNVASGEGPLGSLVQATNGMLYGLTGRGGVNSNKGVLFKFDPSLSIYTKLLDFQGPDPTTLNYPNGSLMRASDGNLYGMNYNGAINGIGDLFKFNPFTSSYNLPYEFTGVLPSDGSNPEASLIQGTDGKFYGMTLHGGIWNLGTLFRFDPDSLIMTTLVSFAGSSNGSLPYGSLVQASDGNIYGMTYAGGTSGLGILFQYNPVTNVFIKKLDFTGTANGSRPYGTLIQATDGMLYGITSQGGLNGDGLIFQFNPATSVYTNRFNFTWATSGSASRGSLMQASDGNLYGMTYGGGANANGTLFQFNPVSSAFAVEVNFVSATTGTGAMGTLMQAADGNLYGMTGSGGVSGGGTLFQFNPVTTVFTKTLDFNGNNGSNPTYNSLTEISTAPNIFISSFNPHACVGTTLSIPFTTVGTFNPGNIFTAQLSDASGSFASPVNIGSITSTTSGTINWVTPLLYPPGTNYKVRIVSSNPAVTGTVNGGHVGIYSWPVITASSTLPSICSGARDTLRVTGASMYSWMPGSLHGNTIAVTPSSTTTYTVIGVAVGACSDTTTVTVNVNALPNVTASASPPSVCIGSSTTLTGHGASTYSWMPGSFNGTSYPVSPTVNTTYTVTGTDVNGCIDTGRVTIAIHTLPTVTATALPTTVCSGSPTTLTGHGAATYSWITGNLSGTSVSYSPTVNTTYSVVGTDVNGCIDTGSVSVNVNAAPPVTASVSTSPVCSGSPTTLTATGAVTYTWLPGAMNGSPVTVSPAVTTTYTVTGTNALGCTNTATVLVTVNALPAVSITPAPSSICFGASTTLTGNGATTYSWMPGSLSGSVVTYSPTINTTYTLTGTDANGCVNTAASVITVHQLPTVSYSAAPSTTVCAGTNVTLSGTGASTYSWSGGIFNSVPFIPSTSFNYTVTGTDAFGCSNNDIATIIVNPLPAVSFSTFPSAQVCSGTNVTLNGTGAVSYAWTGGILDGIPFAATSTSNYTLTGTDANGCAGTATATVTVNPVPTASSGTIIPSGCSVSSGSLTAGYSGGTGPFNYAWFPGNVPALTDNNIPSGSYTFVVTDINSCADSLIVLLDDSCDYVWPGDANEDGIADNSDILAIGIANGAAGTMRANAATNWIGQPSTNWGQTFLSGTDYKFADCDGSGIIQPDDTNAVVQNFGLTHTFRNGGAPNYNAALPDLVVTMGQNMLPSNTMGTMTVALGSSSIPVSNCYGLAFTLNFDPAQIDPASFHMNENGTWMGIPGSNLMGVVLNSGTGTGSVQVAITRLDHANANGFGLIANLSFMTTNALTATGNSVNVVFSITNVTAISASEIPQTVNTVSDSVIVMDPLITGIYSNENAENMIVYPNPFNESTQIIFSSVISGKQNEIILTDAEGRIVRKENVTGTNSYILHREDLEDGIYFCTLRSEEKIIGMTKIVVE